MLSHPTTENKTFAECKVNTEGAREEGSNK
jgi:hypothetical protein